jgi:outer membrane protein OmpA-like peptidoglycan-associated protein
MAEDLAVFVSGSGEERSLVPHVFAATLYGGWTFEDRLRLEVFAPVYGHTRNSVGDAFRGGALGDVLVQANIRIVQRRDEISFSLVPTLGLPTGRPKALVARGPHLKLRAALGGTVAERFGYAANLGFVLAPGAPFEDLAVGSSINGAAAAWVVLDERLRVGADYDLAVGTSNAPGFTNNLATAQLFAQYTTSEGVGLTVAGGRGLLLGVGAPEWRAVAALTWARTIRDKDGDGIFDDVDACPLDPEDFDQWEDLDGCPEADNDEDTLLDPDDTCPNEAEDFDNFNDVDGCPDPDNDEDGVLDVDDVCPVRPGIVEMRGCPDTDRDGLMDDDDQCPADAGPQDLIGCPDRDADQFADWRDACPDVPRLADEPIEQSNGCPRKAFVRGDRIEITERVEFETNKAIIRSQSFGLLDDVVSALKRYPQITLVEVAGHTDNVGSDSANMTLSKKRAASVLTYLIEKGGIDKLRLKSNGYGETEPIDSNFTELGRQKNRRVEFRIQAQGPVTQETDSGLGKDVAGLIIKMPSERPFTRVEVDGSIQSARAPFKGLILTPGSHRVRVFDPERGLDWSTTVEATGGATLAIEVPADAITNPGGGASATVVPSAALPSAGPIAPESGPAMPEPVPDGAPLAVPVGVLPAPAELPGMGGNGAPPPMAPDPDNFPVESPAPWEAAAPPADPTPEPAPAQPEPSPADATVVGPGFGGPVDPKADKAAAKAEAKAAKDAERAAKAEAKARRKGADDEAPPPIVDPNTLPPAAPAEQPKPDDPWSQPQ